MDAKVASLVEGATSLLHKVLTRGGAMRAVDFMKSELVRSNAERLRRIESGEQQVIGVNAFTSRRAVPAGGRGGRHPRGRRGSGDGAAHATRRVARWARRRCRPDCALRTPPGGRHGREPHVGVDRVRPGGGDHRRVVGRAAGGVRGVPRADRGVGAGAVVGRVAVGEARGGPPAGAGGRAAAGPQAEDPRWQAGPGRTLQRCRAGRDPGPGPRHKGDLRGHPAHAGADRAGRGRRGRPRRGAVDPVRLPHGAGTAGRRGAAGGAEGHDVPVVAGGIIPPADEAKLREAGVAAVFTPRTTNSPTCSSTSQ
jgi:ethylmalonyl-CoA mutase